VAGRAEEILLITGVKLGKSYGDQRVLGDLDFQIEAGERVALLGLNGAGKTTLFRCLLALTDFEGELRVAGDTVTPGRKEVRRKIGYVPQQAPLYDMTLAEFVAFFSALRGVSMEGPASTLAELGMSLEETGAKALNELSGGMVQKALLGLALGSGSPVLLLDEPTANLDPGARRDLFRRVRDIAAETTLLFASHRLDEIELLADRVLVLHGGRLAFDGTLEELWQATDAAPRLWLSAPAHEVERLAAALRECPVVSDLRANGAGVEVDVRGDASLDLLLEVRQRGLPVTDFRTRPPSLEHVLDRLEVHDASLVEADASPVGRGEG
jgi:ABC-type multidrug transport system ATPase subunit